MAAAACSTAGARRNAAAASRRALLAARTCMLTRPQGPDMVAIEARIISQESKVSDLTHMLVLGLTACECHGLFSSSITSIYPVNH